MDPLGFALENFNAVGAVPHHRSRVRSLPIDSSGQLPDGTAINGPDDLRQALVARRDQFVQTITET